MKTIIASIIIALSILYSCEMITRSIYRAERRHTCQETCYQDVEVLNNKIN